MTSLHPPSFHRNDFSTCILLTLVTGVISILYAVTWAEPPDFCEEDHSTDGDTCDSIPLTTTNSIQAVSTIYDWYLATAIKIIYFQFFGFIEIGVFGVIILATLKSKHTTSSSSTSGSSESNAENGIRSGLTSSM